MIFAKPLGIYDLSGFKDRETKLINRLKRLKVPDLLCCLNPVFSVNFEMSDMYLNLSEQQKLVVLQKMIKQLCYSVSKKKND